MSVDYNWMSEGGILLDGSGDIAFTTSPINCVSQMVRTRLKAAITGWKQYKIGCGLDDFVGGTSDATAETAIQRRVLQALSTNYLPAGVFNVKTLRLGGVIQVFVYINQQLIASIQVDTNSNNTVVG